MDTEWILINRYEFPVTVLGPGKRIAVWTQGCSIRCNGCMSKHTWDFDETKKIAIEKLIEKLKLFNTTSITISGGEPFEQKGFLSFLKKLRKNGFDDILVYSGYSYEYLKSRFIEHFYFIDVLISEPFEKGNESYFSFKGSNNQKAIVFNKAIFEKYRNFLTSRKEKRLQIFEDMIIGIPFQKDIERVQNG